MNNGTAIKKDFLSGFLLFVLGGGIFLVSRTFPSLPEGYPGPGLFPKWIGIAVAISGIWILTTAWIKILKLGTRFSFQLSYQGHIFKLIIAILLVIAFPFLSPLLGFLPVLGIICFGFALLFQVSVLMAGLVAIGTTGLVYLIFSVLLSVPL